MLDPKKEAFVVQIATITSEMTIHLDRKAQIALLKAKKALIFVPAEYLDFADVFFEKLATVLPKHTEINTHTIDLKEGKQLPYQPIYSLGLVELETLKTYIEINLANGFIRPSKSLASAPILFDQKSDGSFWLCVDYQDLNNLTIKNRYLLLLIDEFFDQLEHAK